MGEPTPMGGEEAGPGVVGCVMAAVELALGLVGGAAGTMRNGTPASRPLPHAAETASSTEPVLATREDISTAYKLLLRRTPDQDALQHYGRRVARGLTLDDLVASVMNSDEFQRRTAPMLGDKTKTGIRQQCLADDVVAVNVGGYVVCVRASDPDIGQAIIATRDYQPHLRRFLTKSVKTGQVVVDVGANVGCLSFEAARQVGPRGLVIAIEPNPDNVPLLYAGILMNRWAHVQIWPCAISDTPGVMSRSEGPSNPDVVPGAPREKAHAHTRLIRLDEALAHLDRVDLIKIDIRGLESRAVRGARGLIEKHRPILLTAFNPRRLHEVEGIAAGAYAEQLLSHYSRLRVLSAVGDDVEFRDANSLMAYWDQRNAELARAAVLPDGVLQFDIIATMDG